MPQISDSVRVDKETLRRETLKLLNEEEFNMQLNNGIIEIPDFGNIKIDGKLDNTMKHCKGSYSMECHSVKENDGFDKLEKQRGFLLFQGYDRYEFDKDLADIINCMKILKQK